MPLAAQVAFIIAGLVFALAIVFLLVWMADNLAAIRKLLAQWDSDEHPHPRDRLAGECKLPPTALTGVKGKSLHKE